ncbi:MAG: hypothetical protein ACRDNC_14270 [Gaiellaceae bacterium]
MAVAFAIAGSCALGSAIVLSVVRGAMVRVTALAGLSLGVVLASAGLPVTVPSYDPYTEVGFGYPIPFVFADLSYGGGHQPVAHPTTEHWNPWEQPALLDLPRFLLSYLVVFALLTVISLGARASWRRVRHSPVRRSSSW